LKINPYAFPFYSNSFGLGEVSYLDEKIFFSVNSNAISLFCLHGILINTIKTSLSISLGVGTAMRPPQHHMLQ